MWAVPRATTARRFAIGTFTAIDFETATYSRDSACAVGIVVVSGKRIVAREQFLIRPPSREFVFTYIHGLTWSHVRNAPRFEGLWPRIRDRLEESDFVAAHNASFDRSVLRRCCESAGLAAPTLPFVCTVNLAREYWNLYPTKLPDVCRALAIPLKHHVALSDAEACAKIVLAAQQAGWKYSD